MRRNHACTIERQTAGNIALQEAAKQVGGAASPQEGGGGYVRCGARLVNGRSDIAETTCVENPAICEQSGRQRVGQ